MDDKNVLESSDSEGEKSCDSNKNENTVPKYRDCKAKQNGSELGKGLRLRQITPEIVDAEAIRHKMLKTELKTEDDLSKALSRARRVTNSTQTRQRQLTGNCTKEKKKN